MNAWLNPEAAEEIQHSTSKLFWGVILDSYSLEEIESLSGEAARIESNTKW